MAPKSALLVDFGGPARARKSYNYQALYWGVVGLARGLQHSEARVLEGADVHPHPQIDRERTHAETKLRCVLAQGHVLLRQGLRRLLEDNADIVEVVGETGDATEALGMIAGQLPDVIITDVDIFRCTVSEAERMIRRESPRSRVLFLTSGRDDDEQASEARHATRETSTAELLEILRRMGSVEADVFDELPRGSSDDDAAERVRLHRRGLTTREREVLELLVAGRTVRSSAEILGLSVKTVDAHKFNLMRKLGIHNKAELVMWAIQKRIVKLPANF